jgi:HK97 family phage major capsid protein
MRVGCNFKSKAIRTHSNFLENKTMNKKQVLKQIRNLTAKQCKQLEVEEAFEGEGTVEAVSAWLGDSTLYGADGNELDLAAVFAADDPATLSLHSGMPDADEPAAEEMIATEIVASVDAPAIEEAMELQDATQASIRRGVRDAIRKTQKSALPRTGGIQMTSNRKHSPNFQSAEDQYISGQWIGAKLLKRPAAIKWWNNNAPSGLKAQSEGTNSAGGFLVPDPLEAAIMDVRAQYGVARRLSRNFPMTSDTLNVPSLTSGATVYYPAENTAITESSAVWGNIALVSAKRACLMKWSNELGADALFSLADVLSDYMGRALGIREDTEWIQGDGSASFGSVTGLLNVGKVATSGAADNWGGLTLANLVATAGTLDDKYHAGASWVMSRQFYTQVVLRLIAAAGGNTIDSLGVGTTGAQFLGYPINFSDQCPTSTAVSSTVCYFGNFLDASVFGDRSGIEIATSDHVNFAEDQINIRATSRYDIQLVLDSGGDSEAFVALVTTS